MRGVISMTPLFVILVGAIVHFAFEVRLGILARAGKGPKWAARSIRFTSNVQEMFRLFSDEVSAIRDPWLDWLRPAARLMTVLALLAVCCVPFFI